MLDSQQRGKEETPQDARINAIIAFYGSIDHSEMLKSYQALVSHLK